MSPSDSSDGYTGTYTPNPNTYKLNVNWFPVIVSVTAWVWKGDSAAGSVSNNHPITMSQASNGTITFYGYRVTSITFDVYYLVDPS